MIGNNPSGRFRVSLCSQAHMALSETIAFSQAVDVADSMTNPKNTLIVVTSDHSHTMTINGYPSRADRIVGNEKHGGETYSILSYANGPSADVDSYEKQSSKYGKCAIFECVILVCYAYIIHVGYVRCSARAHSVSP